MGPETFGALAPQSREIGSWRPAQKPAVCGPFSRSLETCRDSRTGWLGQQGSNRDLPYLNSNKMLTFRWTSAANGALLWELEAQVSASGPDPAGSWPWRGRGGARISIAYLGGPHGEIKDKIQPTQQAGKAITDEREEEAISRIELSERHNQA
jgi:hypothetical protein